MRTRLAFLLLAFAPTACLAPGFGPWPEDGGTGGDDGQDDGGGGTPSSGGTPSGGASSSGGTPTGGAPGDGGTGSGGLGAIDCPEEQPSTRDTCPATGGPCEYGDVTCYCYEDEWTCF